MKNTPRRTLLALCMPLFLLPSCIKNHGHGRDRAMAFSSRFDDAEVRDLQLSSDGNTKTATWSDVRLLSSDGDALLSIANVFVALTRTQDHAGNPVCLATLRIVPAAGEWETVSAWNGKTGQTFRVEVLNDHDGAVVPAQELTPVQIACPVSETPLDASTAYDVAVFEQTARAHLKVIKYRWIKCPDAS